MTFAARRQLLMLHRSLVKKVCPINRPLPGAIESLINEVFVTPHAEIFVIGRKKILLIY